MTRKQLKISGEEDRSILYFRLEHCTDGNNINGISLVVEDKENNLEATLLMINEIGQLEFNSFHPNAIKLKGKDYAFFSDNFILGRHNDKEIGLMPHNWHGREISKIEPI